MSREEARNINWNEVIKKEARGKNDEDLGEVQEVGDTYILVQKGLINKEKFYIPQNEVESYELRTRQEKVFPFCSLCHKLKVEEGIFYL